MMNDRLALALICFVLLGSCMCVEQETSVPETISPEISQSQQTGADQELGVGPYDQILLCSKYPAIYLMFSEMLRARGYSFHTLDPSRELDAELLSNYGILVVDNRDFSGSEISLIENWITSGGSALFIASIPGSQEKNIILNSFGVQINIGYIEDPVNEERYGGKTSGQYVFFYTEYILDHPITEDIYRIEYFSDQSSFRILSGSGFEVIVFGEESAYDVYYTHSPPLIAVCASEGGRIVVSTNIFSGTGEGVNTIGKGSNQLLAYQIVKWLAWKS